MVLTYHEGVHIKCMDVVFTDYEAQVKNNNVLSFGKRK